MSSILIEEVKKTKKNEPRVFPSILMIDKDAFGPWDQRAFVLKGFWKSPNDKLIIARKAEGKSIIGYACYVEMNDGCYLMRIGVKSQWQRRGIGKQLINYLFKKYPKYLSLDVNDDNFKGIDFYTRIGLIPALNYKVLDTCGFIKFETPYQCFHLDLLSQKYDDDREPITEELLKKFEIEVSGELEERDT